MPTVAPPDVKDIQAHTRLSARDMKRRDDAVRRLCEAVSVMTRAAVPDQVEEAWWGLRVSAGPASEADKTGATYWVKRARVKNTGGVVSAPLEFEAYPDTDKRYWWDVVTNVLELQAGTHSLHLDDAKDVSLCCFTYGLDSPPVKRAYMSVSPADTTPKAVKIAAVSTLTGDILTGFSEGATVWDDNDDGHYPVVDDGNGCPKVGDVYPCIGFDGTSYYIATAFARLAGAS